MNASFVVGNIIRSPSDPHARALDEAGMLKKYHCGTRRETKGIDPAKQVLRPAYGLLAYAAARMLGSYHAESTRFALCPSFEKRILSSISPGDNLIGGLGYLNQCIQKVHEGGGLAILDARNSHPSSFWCLVAEEYARWELELPPIYPAHHMRQQRSVVVADYFLVPSMVVKNSFLNAGVPEEKLLYLPYPVDMTTFMPPGESRPPDRPLTISCAGGGGLRKGTPYLLEAFRLIRREVPEARLKFIGNLGSQVLPIAKRMGYDALPIEFSSRMSHPELVRWLHGSDVYVLPSIEEGMVRTVAEAMACGLPVVTTPNSGTNDFISNEVNGSIVPIRDPEAVASAVLRWWDKIRKGEYVHAEATIDKERLGYPAFKRHFYRHLESIGIETGQ